MNYNNMDYHNPYSTYGFNFTYIRNDDEVGLANTLINRLIEKRDDKSNKNLSKERYEMLVYGYNKEIEWLLTKIYEYNKRKTIHTNL